MAGELTTGSLARGLGIVSTGLTPPSGFLIVIDRFTGLAKVDRNGLIIIRKAS